MVTTGGYVTLIRFTNLLWFSLISFQTPVIRERRRFTDIMDEEIDDERKARINRYGTVDRDPALWRIKHELGNKLILFVMGNEV